MVKNMIIQCPSCHEVSELFLSSNAAVIVLNCPHCWTPILSNKSGVYILPENNIKAIKTVKNDNDIMKLLDSMPVMEEQPSPAMREQKVRNYKYSHCQASNAASTTFAGTRDDLISHDDITNLRIKLETCQDSKDFIDQL
jgi:hypothetical protein